MKKFNKEYIIETDRLILKIPDYSYLQSFYDLIDDEVCQFMEWNKLSKPEDYKNVLDNRIKDIENGKRWDSVIIDKNTNEMIGNFGIVNFDENINGIELGYWLAKKYWGNGYIKECIEKIKEIGFKNFGYERILIKATKENINSINVAKKCGFKFDGILRKDAFIKGKYVDKAYYTFLREEYF